MPLLFTEFCNLVDSLEKISRHDPPSLPVDVRQKYNVNLQSWFASYNISIHSARVDPIVLLSALFPAKRTDRVYNIQAKGLSRKLRGCLDLGLGRWQQLEKWQEPGFGDLSENVERILRQAEFPEQFGKSRVTLKDVDDSLARLASRSRFSCPKARRLTIDEDEEVPKILSRIYKRLQSREAKWFTRLLLKEYSCVDLDKHQNSIYRLLDPRFPAAMQMHDNFESAVSMLRNPPTPQDLAGDLEDETRTSSNDVLSISPQIGIKVGPPGWAKAKGGIKHAMTIVDGRAMSIERKYDGEYCQIHVDLTKGTDSIQIYSKSGKDSTADRMGVWSSINRGLRIGQQDCRFRRNCILEGELLVWSDRDKIVLDFHKIRKHVSRSGSFLGTKEDSQYV